MLRMLATGFAGFAALTSAMVQAATPAAAPAPAASAIIALPLNPVVGASYRACALKTASGLGYTELRAGAGAKPGADYYVLIDYIGYLAASGQAFDQAQRSPMPVAGVIPGFSEGLKMMPKGSVYRFCIPAALGYGATGTGPIPANADLIFQVELHDMRSGAEIAAAQQAAQAEAAPATAPAAPSAVPAPAPAPRP